jgi:hypothetical protein
MSAPVTAVTQFAWPADVLEFAARHNIQGCLEQLLEETRRVFPTAQSLKILLEPDPEIQDDWHIDFEVEVPAGDVSDYVEAQHRWTRELYRCCPAPVVYFFRLGLFTA